MDAHTLKPAATLAKHAKAPFPGASAQYSKAREALFAEEIEFRRHMSRLTEQRRALPPGPVIKKDYRFKDENGAEIGFLDLFGKHDTLVTFLDVRAAAGASLPHVHQLARRRERQRRRHQAAGCA
jgi:predicted dithiol-disulfide oxidoreductase (DUF899 family)